MSVVAGIQIVEYDPTWADAAASAITELQPIFRGLVPEIEHIGSTAVPGLAAKPTIDLMAATDHLDRVERREDELAVLGYHRHHNGMTDRLLYVRSTGSTRTHILHIVALDTWPNRNQRLLRDYLRTHPRDAYRYGELKKAIAAAGVHPGDYAKAKTTLIQELTDRARAERGLSSMPVWEKS
ncbi:MAG: GrpB family protein [Actinomycetota bacterium]|nr:GrpB family protein [Actinomycetota bacterium]